MSESEASRRCRSAIPQSGHQGRRWRQRQLRLETLEQRQMLSATALDKLVPPELLVAASPQALDAMPPGFARRIDTINGEQVVSIADPAFAGQLDGGSSAAIAGGALHPLGDLPQLHSNPAATAKIYLDFNGDFEPVWGSFTNVTTPVYDIDGDQTTFSDAELATIYLTWQTVAEDYAPFNIDVTTVEPPSLAPGMPESAANGVAERVAIGGDNSWLGIGGSAGYAQVGSFTNSQVNTVFVFSHSISTDFLRAQQFIGDLASHEAGHGLGLEHQSSYDQSGIKVEEYNSGDGFSAPIMGYQYIGKNVVWYNGTSGIGPTAIQDDMAVIAGSTNGFGYRADDHGDTIATADPLAFDGQTWTGSGIIGTNTDSDVFSFTVTNPGTYRVNADAASVKPDLDSTLELRSAAGTLIAAVAPADSLGASLSAALAPGTYFAIVGKVSTYGYVGTYTMSVAQGSPGITVNTAGPLVVPERGSASFGVVLDSQPTANVTVPLSVSDPSRATLSASSLTFTPANWNVPQTIAVTGTDNGVADGDAPLTIVLGAASSSDVAYAGLDPNDLAAISSDHAYGGFAYWVDRTADVIQRAPLNGGPVETVLDLKALYGGVPGQYAMRGLAIDQAGGKMYWTDQNSSRIQRANLDGTNVETIISGISALGIKLDSMAAKIYWACADKIQRANLDGTSIQDVITSPNGGLWDVAIDPSAGKLYWGNTNDNTIRRANVDGSAAEVLWTGSELSNPRALSLDLTAGKIYWADSGLQQILRADLNGSNPEVLADQSVLGQFALWWLSADSRNGKIYWTDPNRDAVFRMNFDGTGIAKVIDTLNDPQGIAIVAPSVTVTPNSGLITSEGGGSATFKVSLNTPPDANVTIPISSSNSAEGRATVASVTFTPANWNVPQTVTVTGVEDSVVDGDKAYSILLGAATSSDPDYAGIDPRDVALTNRDNETKFFVVDDATVNKTFRYGSDGTARGSSSLATANSAPRGVAGNLAGDKYWVVDTGGSVFVYSNTGTLLGSWLAGGLPRKATPEGIATNGTDVWIVDSSSDKVYRYADAANRLSGTQTAASSFSLNSGDVSPKDIVTDGQSFWVVDDTAKTDKVFKYTTSGTLLGSWTIDAANKTPTGIAIDPTNVSNIWIVDSGTDKVYQYNAAATRISGSQSAALTFALAAGNANAQGIADPPAPVESLPTSDRPTFGAFEVAMSQTSRGGSSATKTKLRVAHERAFASYMPKQYAVLPARGSVTTKFEDGPDEISSELLGRENHTAIDLALTANFADIC